MVWDVSPHILQWGALEVRWYGLLFAAAFLVGLQIMKRIYKEEGLALEELDSLLLHVMLGTMIGARLGHCLFYEPEVYLRDPIRIFKVWEGGLASHGGTLGVFIALYLFVRKHPHITWLWLADRLSIPVALAASFIRLGNFFNSEIIGRPTDLPWGIVFKRWDAVARHPSQLYESLTYLSIFILLIGLYSRRKAQTPVGRLLGVFMVSVFGARFVIEWTKENQVAFEQGMILNMGQLLSVPFVILGGVLLWYSFQPRALPVSHVTRQGKKKKRDKQKKAKK